LIFASALSPTAPWRLQIDKAPDRIYQSEQVASPAGLEPATP
jgi:hypothetical protein